MFFTLYLNYLAQHYWNINIFEGLHPYGIKWINDHWLKIVTEESLCRTPVDVFKRKYKLRMKLVQP